MVIAHHLILSAYGFWLPNDPRGSWSTEVWAANLRPFGDATKTDTRRSVAHTTHDRAQRLAAKKALLYPAVKFTGHQALAIANGIADVTAKLHVTVHALAIMPDHLHMVTARHDMPIENMADFLKRAATRQLNKMKLHPLAQHRNSAGRTPTPWASGGWFVYLNDSPQVMRSIRYVEENPIKAGLKRQSWHMIKPWQP